MLVTGGISSTIFGTACALGDAWGFEITRRPYRKSMGRQTTVELTNALLGAGLQTGEKLPRPKLDLTSNAAGGRYCLWNAVPGRGIRSHTRNGKWPLADWLDHSHCRLLLQPDRGSRTVWNYPELYFLLFVSLRLRQTHPEQARTGAK